MYSKHLAWREAARVFLLSRLLFLIVTFSAVFLFRPIIPGFAQRFDPAPGYVFQPQLLSTLFYSWLRWDVKAFLNVSYFGYVHTPDVSFFPLWPLIQHVGGVLLGNTFPYSFYISGLLLTNLFFYLALVACYHLLANDFDHALARRALYCLAFAPYALFFFAGYSEALFLALCLTFFLLLRRERTLDYWLAGLVGCLATLTRSTGLVLAVPFLVIYIQRFWLPPGRAGTDLWQKLYTFAPIALIPLGMLVYILYLWLLKGNPLIFTTQEEAIWGRQFTAPWITLVMVFQAIIQAPSPIFILLNSIDLLVVSLTLLTLALGWRHIPWHYRLFALTQICFDLLVPSHTVEPLLSQTRFMLPIFPITIILAFWGKKPVLYRLMLGVMIIFLTINTILFLDNVWIA